MASEPTWQPNYVDLSDDRTVRLGGQCLVCGARYESPVARLDLDPAFGFAIQGALEQELSDLKYRAFTEFDAAYNEITFDCPRCGRHACIDCWDADHRMCGACVASHGLKRSPHRGIAADGPLADGRLRCVEHGQFADAAQPQWLDALLSAEPQHSGDLPPGLTDTSWMRKIGETSPRRDSENYPGQAGPAFSMALHETGTLAHEPTTKIASLPEFAPRAEPFNLPNPRAEAAPLKNDPFSTPEGKVTSAKVKCPRCGAANYDFVTNCNACQLQLIQNCPMCGKLNPGHAQACEFCGSSLDRPRGWAAIQDVVQPLSPAEARVAAPRPKAPPKKSRTAKLKASQPAPPPAPTRPDHFNIDPDTGPLALPSFLPASYDQAPAAAEDEYESGTGERLLLVVERVFTVVFWLIVLTVAGAIAAAEISPHANTMIRSVTHLDIRVILAHFGVWARHTMNRLHS